jgi:Secretion system C-terminal sorting domain
LFQNSPNPFNGATVIGFNLPESTTANIKIYDVSGKTLKMIQGDYAKGFNQISLTKAELNATGVLYYQIDTPTHTATKKMIKLE